MAATLTIADLLTMSVSDLNREVAEQAAKVAKLRLGITMKKEKDSALYKREKKQLARMKTVLGQKIAEESLSASAANSTVPQPKQS